MCPHDVSNGEERFRRAAWHKALVLGNLLRIHSDVISAGLYGLFN